MPDDIVVGGMTTWRLGFGVYDVGFGIWGFGLGVWDLGFEVEELGLSVMREARVPGFGLRIERNEGREGGGGRQTHTAVPVFSV